MRLMHPTAPRRPQMDAFAGSISARRHNHALGSVRSDGVDSTDANLHCSRLIVHTVHLGQGRRCWRRARRLLLEWRMHEGSSWSAVHKHPTGGLVTLAAMPHPRLPLFWVLNPCRVVCRVDGRRQASVGYATLEGHLIAGEERMSVRRGPSGDVTFEVLSLSRGAGPVGKLLFFALGRTQDRFFREQCRCMREQAADAGRPDAQAHTRGEGDPVAAGRG